MTLCVARSTLTPCTLAHRGTLLQVEWNEQEQHQVEQACSKFPPSKYSPLERCVRIAAMLPRKGVRDVAMRLQWLTVRPAVSSCQQAPPVCCSLQHAAPACCACSVCWVAGDRCCMLFEQGGLSVAAMLLGHPVTQHWDAVCRSRARSARPQKQQSPTSVHELMGPAPPACR